MSKIEHPYYPIIYVRGYAGTQGAVEDTVATPYMGFNLGSTKYRQAYRKEDVFPWVFESPLLRLMKDHGYRDVYEDGQFLPEGSVGSRSVWIFRYYDITSKALGDGDRKEVEFHARRLRDLILRVREAVLAGPGGKPRDFRVNLVAHSMGGLVCRSYLQNPAIPDLDDRTGPHANNRGVDKLFTYATPHGGIEFRKGLGWTEGLRDFLDVNNSGNFGEKRMREFLGLGKDQKVQTLTGPFPTARTFCLVGTDSRDYGAAAGLSRRSVGPISDGLVQIRNATLSGAPRAYVHRSHSGHYGIVNSEEGYQNLQRFLFGNLKVDLLMENVVCPLPNRKNIDATYYVETIVSIRGMKIEMHRRTVDNESAIFRSHTDLTTRPLFLHSSYLDKSHITKKSHRKSGTMGFLVRLRVLPEYHIDKTWRPDDHYEGAAILDDGLVFQITPLPGGKMKCSYQWTSEQEAGGDLDFKPDAKKTGRLIARIPFTRPKISGDLVVRAEGWNSK